MFLKNAVVFEVKHDFVKIKNVSTFFIFTKSISSSYFLP